MNVPSVADNQKRSFFYMLITVCSCIVTIGGSVAVFKAMMQPAYAQHDQRQEVAKTAKDVECLGKKHVRDIAEIRAKSELVRDEIKMEMNEINQTMTKISTRQDGIIVQMVTDSNRAQHDRDQVRRLIEQILLNQSIHP